jgi:hypothetical protein
MSRLFANLIIRWLMLPSLTIVSAAIPAPAQSRDYIFLVGSGFLCDLEFSACPAAVKSAQGDSYEMSGEGTFNTQSKAVTATGTFTHRSTQGETLETGIWIGGQLASFQSYGVVPGALARGGRAFAPPPFGPGRLPMLTSPMPAGGLAVFRIRLVPVRGPSRNAILQVNCALGKVPDERQTEGIRLSSEQGSGEFDEELGGRTMFLATRPGTLGAR